MMFQLAVMMLEELQVELMGGVVGGVVVSSV